MNINVDVNLEDLAFSIAATLDYQDCLSFIKEIDNNNSDWEFTERILKYCLEQVLKESNSDITEILGKDTKRDIKKLFKIISDEN